MASEWNRWVWLECIGVLRDIKACQGFFIWHSIYGVNTRDCTKIIICQVRRAQGFSKRARVI